MPLYVFTGGDARDYFPIGRVEVGDIVELDIPPDVHWRPAGPLVAPLPPEQPAAVDPSASDAPVASEEV